MTRLWQFDGCRGRRLVPTLLLALLPALVVFVSVVAPPLVQAQNTRVSQASQGFWDAIRLDDVKAMQTQMLRGASANAMHPEHGPAIVYAARERSPKALGYLAQLSGTRLDAVNARDETALMLVALHGDLDSAKLLITRGAEVNRPGWTPLHYAASGGHVPVIDALLEAHAFIDAQSPNGTTPLMMAARHKHTNAVRMLVESGADPTLRNEAGIGPAEYMEGHGERAEAAWLREQAQAFRRRYGTVDAPKPAAVPAPRTADKPVQAVERPVGQSVRATDAPAPSADRPAETHPVRLPGMRD
jgi:ankyrin repeat protein